MMGRPKTFPKDIGQDLIQNQSGATCAQPQVATASPRDYAETPSLPRSRSCGPRRHLLDSSMQTRPHQQPRHSGLVSLSSATQRRTKHPRAWSGPNTATAIRIPARERGNTWQEERPGSLIGWSSESATAESSVTRGVASIAHQKVTALKLGAKGITLTAWACPLANRPHCQNSSKGQSRWKFIACRPGDGSNRWRSSEESRWTTRFARPE